MGSRNISQMVNYIFIILFLIIVKNNKATGVKNEKVEWIKLKYPAPISQKKEQVGVIPESLNISF